MTESSSTTVSQSTFTSKTTVTKSTSVKTEAVTSERPSSSVTTTDTLSWMSTSNGVIPVTLSDCSDAKCIAIVVVVVSFVVVAFVLLICALLLRQRQLRRRKPPQLPSPFPEPTDPCEDIPSSPAPCLIEV